MGSSSKLLGKPNESRQPPILLPPMQQMQMSGIPHHTSTPGPYSASGKKQAVKWTKQEDETLKDAVEEHGAKNWKLISSRLPGRSEVQCLHRWQKVLKPSLVKGPWTAEEDRKVVELVKKHGAKPKPPKRTRPTPKATCCTILDVYMQQSTRLYDNSFALPTTFRPDTETSF